MGFFKSRSFFGGRPPEVNIGGRAPTPHPPRSHVPIMADPLCSAHECCKKKFGMHMSHTSKNKVSHRIWIGFLQWNIPHRESRNTGNNNMNKQQTFYPHSWRYKQIWSSGRGPLLETSNLFVSFIYCCLLTLLSATYSAQILNNYWMRSSRIWGNILPQT